MTDHMPKCDWCGRFHNSMAPGSSYAMRYSGWPLTPDHEAKRCVACTEKQGPLAAQLGVADWTAGVIKTADLSSTLPATARSALGDVS